MTDNDDKCYRIIHEVKTIARDGFNEPGISIYTYACGNNKSPDRLYCPSCEAEVYDEKLAS